MSTILVGLVGGTKCPDPTERAGAAEPTRGRRFHIQARRTVLSDEQRRVDRERRERAVDRQREHGGGHAVPAHIDQI